MSALGVRAEPPPEGPRQASFYELVERLLSDAFTLFDHKLALAALEMKQHAESAARGLAVVAAGALAATIGLSLLAVAAALAIGRALDSPAGGYVIVGAVIAVAGAIAIAVGRSRLARLSLAPHQTIDELRRDAQWITHEMRKRSG